MKNSLILMFLLLISINLNPAVPEKNDYIEIMHTGASSSKYIAPLIISKHRLDIQLSRDEQGFLVQLQKTRQLTKEDYIRILYSLVVTNDETYSSILNFIQNTQEYYTNGVDLNPPNSSDNFTIIADGKTYDLYWKYKYDFLNKLTEYLTLKNCDKIVINKISSYK